MSSRLTSQTLIVLDEQDTDRIWRLLYNGTRPKRVHTVVCACGRVADLRVSEDAWVGWKVYPYAKCPDCLARDYDQTIQEIAGLYPSQAYETFVKRLEQVMLRKARSR